MRHERRGGPGRGRLGQCDDAGDDGCSRGDRRRAEVGPFVVTKGQRDRDRERHDEGDDDQPDDQRVEAGASGARCCNDGDRLRTRQVVVVDGERFEGAGRELADGRLTVRQELGRRAA